MTSGANPRTLGAAKARGRFPALASGRALFGVLFGLVLVGLTACSGGGTAGDSRNRGPFEVLLATTGTGQIFPYRIAQADSLGNPTSTILDITDISVLKDNVGPNNSVLPTGTWQSDAKLPNGSNGNHYLRVRFSHDLKIESILSANTSDLVNSGLTGAIQVLKYNPTTEETSYVTGRAFVGGYTYYDNLATTGLDLELVQAVKWNEDTDSLDILDARANGFPTGFSGADALVEPNTFVFVPDANADDDLTDFETFPQNYVIKLVCTPAVLNYRDRPLTEEVKTTSTVGADTIAPEVLGYTKISTGGLQVTPANGATGVDPELVVQVNFSKPVQPRDVGLFFSTTDKTPASQGLGFSVSIANNTFPWNYYADPISASDLCTYYVRPAYLLPSNSAVTFQVNSTINSLANQTLTNNISTTFTTGAGPGLVNAPVAPEAIYVGISGSSPGISVIDLNGFGQGTGDPAQSNFTSNLNISNPGMIPSLSPGTSGIDAGGAGALTLTTDSNGNSLLADRSILNQVEDIQIGQPLDKIFNNLNVNAFVTTANQVNPLTGSTARAWGNSITIAPHPNPPKLIFPPPNPARNIFAEESTVNNAVPQGCVAGPLNRLVAGNPFKSDGTQGVFFTPAPGAFFGPQPSPGTPAPAIPYCPYMTRQQIGHFLYVLDRSKKSVLVLNSNRMQLLETIALTDPIAMGVSPNLKRLAVANFSANNISFIDIDPASPTFHQIVKVTNVGSGPSSLAWQPDGEDLLVACRLDSSITVIRGSDLEVRKSVAGQINNPIDIVVTARQNATGFLTGIYFAYILNGDSRGTITVFESGPDGVNGIGYDDTVGIPEEAAFTGATTMQVDTASGATAVWVAHRDSRGLGQVSHLELTSSPTNPQPIQQNQGNGISLPPTFRTRLWTVNGRLGGDSPTTPIKDRLSGNSPVDIAMDDLFNVGAYGDQVSIWISNLVYADHSGKGHLKLDPNGNPVPASLPRFIFVALGDTGKVDVIEIDSGNIVKTIDVPGVSSLAHYWRQ